MGQSSTPSESVRSEDRLGEWRAAFSNRKELLSLLLHCSLLGGSTKVEIGFKPEECLLVIRDDGHETALLETLDHLRAAARGEAETFPLDEQDSDSRRLAALLSTTWHLQVLTGDYRLSLIPDRFVMADEFTLKDRGSSSAGTTLAFKLLPHLDTSEDTLRHELALVLAGYPLPTTFQGRLIPRPDAFDPANFHRILNGYSLMHAASIAHTESRAYIDGLPVRVGKPPLGLPGGFTLHLDGETFATDPIRRDTLHCSDTAYSFLERELQEQWREHLAAIKKRSHGEHFIRGHALDCHAVGADNLLNDAPLHPSQWGRYHALPCPSMVPTAMAELGRHELLNPTRQIHADLAWLGGGVMSVAAAYVFTSGWPVIRGHLDENHWAVRNSLSAASLNIHVEPREIEFVKRTSIGTLGGLRLVFCRNYALRTNQTVAPDLEDGVAPVFCAKEDTVYLTPASLPDLASLLLQLHSYRTREGGFDRKQLSHDQVYLAKALEEIFGPRIYATRQMRH